ncbi:MAG: hypothetical protein ACOC0R_03000 [Mariniphaga sp.]
MSIANSAEYNEWLYQEYVAAKVAYKIAQKQSKRIPDDNPQKAEILKRLQEMKDKMVLIDTFLLKNIDSYSELLDSELHYSLREKDIILLREELKAVKKSIINLQT